MLTCTNFRGAGPAVRVSFSGRGPMQSGHAVLATVVLCDHVARMQQITGLMAPIGHAKHSRGQGPGLRVQGLGLPIRLSLW